MDRKYLNNNNNNNNNNICLQVSFLICIFGNRWLLIIVQYYSKNFYINVLVDWKHWNIFPFVFLEIIGIIEDPIIPRTST